MAVDNSPEAAQSRYQSETKTRDKLLEKQRQDLIEFLGEIGKDNGRWQVGQDNFGQLVLFENIYNKKGEYIRKDEIFFWVDPNGIDFRKKTGSSVIKEIKTLYKGNLEKLRKTLYDKNFISKDELTTKDETAFNQGIIQAARNFSVNQAQTYTVEGNNKFTPFNKWIVGLGSVQDTSKLPVRDINLIDRDVVEAIVKDAYSRTTDMSTEDADIFIQEQTDKYMKQIKEGTLTTLKQVGGEMVRKTTKSFSQAQVEAELPKEIKKQMPGITNYKTNLDFLAFMNSLGAPVV